MAHASGALRSQDLERVTVDTTVQPKNVSFPTDAKLLHAATSGLTACPASMECVRSAKSQTRKCQMAVVGYVAGKISPFLCASADASLARRATDFSPEGLSRGGPVPENSGYVIGKTVL